MPVRFYLMNFDFHTQYKRYSNIELLKIVKHPDGYQQEAITAATQILDARQVTEEEIRFVEHYYNQLEKGLKAEKEKIESYKDDLTRILDPILTPTEKVDPVKWFYLLLSVMALQYGWTFFTIVKYC